MIKSNRGQLSIFLGITLVLVMAMLAFIINVGLFVKAKINLQNSVDSAAFAGAAVQARQLTNIAYLNWEMRNNYKEWMFKYYVLGQLSSYKGGKDFPLQTSLANLGGNMDFKLKNYDVIHTAGGDLNVGGTGGDMTAAKDEYNVPSICIHNSTATDICPSYVLPGLPRFPAIGVAGVSEIHETFVTQLKNQKQTDCSLRSALNFHAALVWAYGDGSLEDPKNPTFAAGRPGAWPRAIEMAIRMRNLEMIVNLPPLKDIDGASAPHLPEQGTGIALNERPYKAYMSAYKNLAGGKYKDEGQDELAANFKLTELAPKPTAFDSATVSGFLIKKDFTYKNGMTALNKHYLDLQAVPLNLATLYTAFVSTVGKLDINTQIEGACGVSKTAMPVPGFILGFQKNPDIMTYYAVKGETKFIGLFSPFKGTSNQNGVTLTAYAAAKPFGGRIGPRLFSYDGQTGVTVRVNDPSYRSLPYIYGLNKPAAAAGPTGIQYRVGDPIPASSDFWVSSNAGQKNLGGVPNTSGSTPYFGIPNMAYDYVNITSRQIQTGGLAPGAVAQIEPRAGLGTPDKFGLYDPQQLTLLKNSFNFGALAGGYTSHDILKAIAKARRPTRYDAANYLVPDWKQASSDLTTYPMITETGPAYENGLIQPYSLFAPLVGPDVLYHTSADLNQAMGEYINSTQPAVTKYLKGLLDVANSVANLVTIVDATATPGSNTNIEAAKTIHANAAKPPGGGVFPPDLDDAHCAPDIASRFAWFFQTRVAATRCQTTPLDAMMIGFIDQQSNHSSGKHMNFMTEYYIGPEGTAYSGEAMPQKDLLTAYFPGKRQGVTGGLVSPPIGGVAGTASYAAKRNSYSTKFVKLASLIDHAPGQMTETALREELEQVPPEFITNHPLNLLNVSDFSGGYTAFFYDF